MAPEPTTDNPDRHLPEANLEIQAQLDDLRHLENGWLDGDGLAPNRDWLDWLAGQFTSEFPDGLPRPHIYPTPEGGVLAEWWIGPNSASLEVNLKDRSGYWHNAELANQQGRRAHA